MSSVWQVCRLVAACFTWGISLLVLRSYSRWRFRLALRRRGLSADEVGFLSERYHPRIRLRELIHLFRVERFS